MHIPFCCWSTDQGDESYFNVDVSINKIVVHYFAWELQKTTNEMNSLRGGSIIDAFVRVYHIIGQ